MKISVITICFNSENVIRKTIESVLKQNVEEVEYHIVDGGSTDKTILIAEEYENAFIEKGWSFFITSEKDEGIYDAMNKGIKRSTGELISIINSGDWFEPEMLETVQAEYNKKQFDFIHIISCKPLLILQQNLFNNPITSHLECKNYHNSFYR